jgi:peptide/nickel transport system permease protein
MLIILALAVPIGVMSHPAVLHLRQGHHDLRLPLGFATPDFWLALLLMILFGCSSAGCPSPDCARSTGST